MPRRHRSARDREDPPEAPGRPLGGFAPTWAQAEGTRVLAVAGSSDKTYVCPGCLQEIRSGVPHLVVIGHGDVQGRRHWHTPCWRRDLRRRGLA